MGMVSVPETIEVIAAALKKYCPPVVVIDPVMVSKSGFHLLRPDAVSAMKKQFLPLGAVLTPNVPEAEILCGRKIESHRDMEAAAEYLYAMGALAVVIKGGHLQGDADDLVYDGKEKIWLPGKRIATKNTHGTGCTISSAIASYMAKGENVAEAVRKAKEYVTGAIQHAIAMGSGCGPTHHFYRIWKEEIQEERKDINDTKNDKMLTQIVKTLQKLREEKPLVDCITNRVTINDCANILLAAGGSPIMAEDEREIEEIVAISQGVVMNLGILDQKIISTMLKAGKVAKQRGIPVIFDPVGAGASRLRDALAQMILNEVRPDVIRGNFSEIRSLSGAVIQSRGVDAAAEDAVNEENMQICGKMVQELAKKYRCTVCATGAIDLVSDGEQICYIKNGDPMLCDVTGTGCMCSALTGATCAAGGAFIGAMAAVVLLGLAGEYAAESCKKNGEGIGTFRIKMMDAIYLIRGKDIMERGAVYGGELL